MSFWVRVFGVRVFVVWVFVIPKRRSPKLRLLEVNKKKGLNSSQSSPEMCYGHAKFTGGNSQKESTYSPSPVYRCRVWWIQNWLQFQQYFSDSVSSISSVKNSQANAIKISAAILQTVNLLSFSLFDRCDSDKPEKINILLLSGCCLWKLHDHKTLGDKNWDEFT